jgi:tetratricopeptide (TPR) repeat protein
MRSGEFEQSITVGHRAVELEDYNPWANYFYASELLISRSAAMRGLGDYDSEGMKDGIRHMHRAVELNPSLQPGLMTLCWAYALHGQYDEAMTYVGRAVALEEAAAARGFSFVGGQTVQGHMFRRKGDWSQARLAYERSLEFLEQSQHVYRNSFLAQTWCGLGDVEFARGSYDTALTHYGKVLELTLAEPMQTSNGFSYVRANARMAKAYNLMGVHNLSEKKMQHAVDTLHKREGMSFFWMWDSCDAQVHFDLASAYAELRRNDDAINSLEEAAVRLGFRDLHAIEADANLWALKDDPRMKAIVSTIQSTPPLP